MVVQRDYARASGDSTLARRLGPPPGVARRSTAAPGRSSRRVPRYIGTYLPPPHNPAHRRSTVGIYSTLLPTGAYPVCDGHRGTSSAANPPREVCTSSRSVLLVIAQLGEEWIGHPPGAEGAGT